jgi:hypothetical protein
MVLRRKKDPLVNMSENETLGTLSENVTPGYVRLIAERNKVLLGSDHF